MSDKYKLDGTDDIKPTPFDAHEQVVRGHHTFSREKGYQAAEKPYDPEEHGGEKVSE